MGEGGFPSPIGHRASALGLVLALLELLGLDGDDYPIRQVWVIRQRPQKLLQGFFFALFRHSVFLLSEGPRSAPPYIHIVHLFRLLVNTFIKLFREMVKVFS